MGPKTGTNGTTLKRERETKPKKKGIKNHKKTFANCFSVSFEVDTHTYSTV